MARRSRGASRDWDAPFSSCVALVATTIVATFDPEEIQYVLSFTDQPNAFGSAAVRWVLDVSDDGGLTWTQIDFSVTTYDALGDIHYFVDPSDGTLYRFGLVAIGNVPACSGRVDSNPVEVPAV